MPYLAQLISSDFGESFYFLDPYLATIKVISAIICALFFTGIVILIVKLNFVAMKVSQYKEMISGDGISKQRTVKIWKQIQADLNSSESGRWKVAVIEADKTLDEVLNLSGYKGESMSERLKQLTAAQIGNIDDIWVAHKIRNQIAHEAGFELSHDNATRIIGFYEIAFRQLGLVD